MLHTTANDIICMDFDWLMLLTTANKIIGIKMPNLHKILSFCGDLPQWTFCGDFTWWTLNSDLPQQASMVDLPW